MMTSKITIKDIAREAGGFCGDRILRVKPAQ